MQGVRGIPLGDGGPGDRLVCAAIPGTAETLIYD